MPLILRYFIDMYPKILVGNMAIINSKQMSDEVSDLFASGVLDGNQARLITFE
jgi:hypothetical protein